jgi:glycosyltransferase involved in cell wall biosynthesis
MNTLVKWDNQKLEPVLITYNRSADLQRTLAAFLSVGLTSIRLHVLDNASTDDTATVVATAQAKWPNLIYHKNIYNIGGNANILRAVEIANSEYSWVVGDDDSWQLEDISELCAVLNEGKADVIRLGWLVSEQSRGKMLEATELVERENMFFASLSMISATIIRRDIITPNLPHSYMGINDAYPQLVPILRSIGQRPLQTYTVSHDLMMHTPSTTPGYYFGDLEWWSSWFRMSRFLEVKKLRRIFVGEVARYMSRNRPGPLNEFMGPVKAALNYKALGVNQWPYLLSMLAYGAGWHGRVVGLMAIYGILPMKVATWLRKIYFFTTGRPDKGLRFDRTRL